MGKQVIVYDDEGNPTHVREVADDERSSVLYEYKDGFYANLSGEHRGKEIEFADHHEDGRTDAYEYDSSFYANLFDNHRGKKKNEDKGGCFLTTACVAYAGLPDDCEQLVTLRRYRDEYVGSLPNGAALLGEYYQVAPQIVAKIEVSEGRNAFLGEIFEVVQQAVRDIREGREAQAFERYSELFSSLKARLGA